MEVRCPNCSSRFNLPDQLARPGVKLRCSVCKTVFAYDPAEQLAAQGPLPDMPVKKRSRLGKLLGLLLLILVCAGGAYWYFKHSATGESSPPTEQELAKKVEMLTMRNVRQYLSLIHI